MWINPVLLTSDSWVVRHQETAQVEVNLMAVAIWQNGTPKRSVGIGPRNENTPFLHWKKHPISGQEIGELHMNFVMFPSKITNLLSCTTHFGWSNMKTNCWNLKYHFLGETYPKRIPIMCHVCHRISTSGSSWGYGFMCSPVETNPQKLRIVRI